MECVICLVCQPLICFKRNIDLVVIIGLDVALSESILDLAFSDLECWGQLALLFCLFLSWLLMFLKYVVFVGQLLYVRITAERWLLLSLCGIEWGLDNACSGLFLVVGFLMRGGKCGWQTLILGKEIWCGENSDWWKNSACIHYSSGFCFHLLIFLIIQKTLRKVESFESVECFFCYLLIALKDCDEYLCNTIHSSSIRYITGLY